ncbi:MAG TPA: Crp/Fnr family transcriptional regulator [Bacteroidia bacterium]|jgi:CRP-like cAMP-binding protein
MQLITYISSIIPVSDQLENALNSLSQKKEFPKNEVVLDSGERCTELLFIDKGLFRGYYYDEDGKEITGWFARENEFATSFYSFISNEPAPENIQALESCEVTVLSHSVLQSLYINFPETERIGRIITENYYIKLEERLLGLQFKTARERYGNLVHSKPKLLQRVPLGQIASYLGITQETLSRIRAGT